MGTFLRRANDALNRFEIGRRRVKLLSRPVELSLETCNRCNSLCPMCANPVFSEERPEILGEMNWDVFQRTRPLWRYARSIELSGNGEPFLNEGHLDMATALKRAGCFVHSYTNGILLTPQVGAALVDMGYDQLHVSIGGATRDTYHGVRGVDGFEAVVDNLGALRDAKAKRGTAKPNVRFNVAAMRSVLAELPELVRLAGRLGVTAIDMFHLVVYYDKVRSESAWLDVEGARQRFAEAQKVAAEVGVELLEPSFTPTSKFCRLPFTRFLVRWDGVVVSCPHHRFLLGDVTDSDPLSIWNDRPWVNLRRDIWTRGYGELCPACYQWRANDADLLLHATSNTGADTTDLRG